MSVALKDAHTADADAAIDAALAAERRELKFFLRPEAARSFVDALNQQLEVHRFRGRGASEVPRPVHYITTLYFDTDDRQIAARCRAGSENLKLRAREYYDEHPDLTELATSPRELSVSDGSIWLELKTKTGGSTQKLRFPLPAGEVPGFLAGGVVTQRAAEMQENENDERGEELLKGIWRLCRRVDRPLRPDCIAHYRRRAWQSQKGALRVTLDTRVAFYRPRPGLLQAFHGLRDGLEEPPVQRLDRYLVELKLHQKVPSWFAELANAVGLEPARRDHRAFSKFLAASDAVHQGS